MCMYVYISKVCNIASFPLLVASLIAERSISEAFKNSPRRSHPGKFVPSSPASSPATRAWILLPNSSNSHSDRKQLPASTIPPPRKTQGVDNPGRGRGNIARRSQSDQNLPSSSYLCCTNSDCKRGIRHPKSRTRSCCHLNSGTGTPLALSRHRQSEYWQ